MWFIIVAACFILVETKIMDIIFDNPFLTGNLTQQSPFQPVNNLMSRILVVSLFPENPRPTTFLLFTNVNPDSATHLNLTKKSISEAEMFHQCPTKIIIHGFFVKLEPRDVRFQIKDELIKNGSCNVIMVDWTKQCGPSYAQAAANTRAVGAQVAKLVTLLVETKDISLEDVHIIGHSLGAHIAGYAGERLKNLSRITGLDPAGPFFSNAPSEIRLDRTDANFVDIIHTNAANIYLDGFGIKEAIGHLDFYPNGGSHQPSCSFNHKLALDFKADIEALTDFSCDHSRSYYLFRDSINTCLYSSVRCSSYKKFKAGFCTEKNSRTSVMGLHAEKLSGLGENDKFYLYTSGSSPFCAVKKPETLPDLLSRIHS